MKLECYLTNLDFKSVELPSYNDFINAPSLSFGLYDKAIFVNSPLLQMDFHYDYLMKFISCASRLYHFYEDKQNSSQFGIK